MVITFIVLKLIRQLYHSLHTLLPPLQAKWSYHMELLQLPFSMSKNLIFISIQIHKFPSIFTKRILPLLSNQLLLLPVFFTLNFKLFPCTFSIFYTNYFFQHLKIANCLAYKESSLNFRAYLSYCYLFFL